MWHLLKDMRKKDKGLAFLAVLLIAGQVFLDLKLPDYTKEITVLISSETNTISDSLMFVVVSVWYQAGRCWHVHSEVPCWR